MSLAHPEDAPALLEQFIHDVANTPAEITHLLQEIQAKDTQIAAFRDEITKRDTQLQKFVRANGGNVANPKEEQFNKVVGDCYDRAEILQAEKCGLAERSLIVLERQIKRLDVGLRALAAREEFPGDWGGPSLVNGLGSGTGTGVSTPALGAGAGALPLQTVSGNIGSAGGIPNVAQLRIAQQQAATSVTSGIRSGQQTPTGAGQGGAGGRSHRESSTEAGSTKRRRINPSLGSLPPSSSNLRQSSLGPGTPKAGTPGPATNSRAGSAQPTQPKATTNAGMGNGVATTVAATTGVTKKSTTSGPAGTHRKAPPSSTSSSHLQAPQHARKNRARGSSATSKRPASTADRRKALARSSATPSTTTTNSSDGGRSSASPSPSALAATKDGATDTADKSSERPDKIKGRPSRNSATVAVSDEEDEEEAEDDAEENDDTLYCYCQKVSFGDMVGCDNDNCEFQWFHWDCVGLKSEPEGQWLCPTCKKLPRAKLVLSQK